MILRFSLRGLSLNKDTIPSEIAGKPAVYLEPLQNINQQNIILQKKGILLTNDSLAPKQ